MNAKGFSLVELMVVIAIVALLAAVAVPSYRDYAGRAALTSVYNLIQNQMDYVAQQYSQGSTTAKTMSSPVTGVTSIVATPTSTGGTVAVTFPVSAASPFGAAFTIPTAPVVVTYTGTDSSGVLSWACTSVTAVGTSGQSTTNRGNLLTYMNQVAGTCT